jgi:hypothetical protein
MVTMKAVRSNAITNRRYLDDVAVPEPGRRPLQAGESRERSTT